MPQRLASSATASCAWRFVPRKRMVLPLLLCSLTNRAASRNSFNVFCRSMMWIPLRSPKMYSFILGFQRRGLGARLTALPPHNFFLFFDHHMSAPLVESFSSLPPPTPPPFTLE